MLKFRKNSPTVIFLILFTVLCVVSFVGVVQFGMAQNSTNVSGIISSDTTWTKANSPYSLTGHVRVNSGVTLTIEPGVSVNLNSCYIQVDGTFVARGSDTDKIYLNGGYSGPGNYAITFNDQTVTGSIIDKAVLSSTPIIINGVSPKIDNCSISGTLDYGIRVIGGSPIVTNNAITNTGILIEGGTSGGPVIRNNIVTNTGYSTGGYGIACSANASISDNIISGWREYGGVETYSAFQSSGGFPVIERNLMSNNKIAISVGILLRDWFGATFPIIQNNTIIENSVGLQLGYSDQTGYGSQLQRIIYNNIQNNSNYNFYLSYSNENVNATYNWWGTTDVAKINQSIYDFKNDFNLGTVTFVPFLIVANPAAPTGPPPEIRPPIISVISPENKTYTGSDVPLTLTVDEHTSWIGYSLDDQVNITITGNTNLTDLSNGSHNITVYAEGISGNIGSSGVVYFTIDTAHPSVSIISPQNKTYTTTDIQLTFKVDEKASWILYSLDRLTNVTITGNTTLTGFSNGLHNITVYVSDMAGNTGTSETIYFTIAQKTEPKQEPFPTTWIVAAIAIIAVGAVVFLVYFRKIKKTTGKAE